MQYDAYTQLIQKLDDFIRKFYLNRIIKGTLISISLLFAIYLAVVLLEHYYFTSFQSSTTFRTLLFSTLSVGFSFTLFSLVLIPVFNYFKLGKLISKQYAAKIIGDHFNEVEDKLLNVLQLKHTMDSGAEMALVQASIEQKSNSLRLVPFTSAIDLTLNRKYLRFILPPLLLFFVILFSSNMIGDSTHRLINMNTDFKRDAAFQFILPQNQFKVVQYNDLTIEVGVEGRSVPDQVFIEVDNYRYKLQKKSSKTFSYTFTEVRKDLPFRLYASSIFSEDCLIDVIEKPSITEFDIMLDYPSYTGMNDEMLSGTADLTIPEGTNVKWQLDALHTNDVIFQFDDKSQAIDQKSDQIFSYERRLFKSGMYHVFLSNQQLGMADSMSYVIQVIKDKYPSIEMKALSDSTQEDMRFFGGSVGDDYGVKELNFSYSIIRDGNVVRTEETNIPLANKKQSTFSHVLDLSVFELKTGDRLDYYFEVWDNDAVNGSKSTRSATMTYMMPTVDELKENESTNNEEIKSELEEALKKMKQLGQDVQKVKNKILQKKELNWQDKREIENLMKNREEIEKEINKANENFKENLENQEKFQKISEELMEKQEKLSEMFDEMMNEEMKELFEQMEKLLEELSQEEMKEQLDEIDFSEDEMEKELDRMLELFKKMEVEKNMEDIVNELDSLAKEEEKESDLNALDNNETSDSSATKQDELNEKFEELMEKYEETQKKNDALESPFDMENEQLDNLQKEIQENQQDASDNLNKGDKKNASKSQKNASKKMKEMSKGMQSMMQMNKMEQMEQDLKAMRQLLEDLLMLSFGQEDILQGTHSSNVGSPSYLRNAKLQGNIKTDFKIVEDSLQALSKRVIQLQSFINEKVTDVKRNLDRSIESLEDRQKSMALVQQQFAMTGINDIALMLSESMDQMQQNMADQMPGQQMCEKPGGQSGDGQPGMGKGKDGQKPGFDGLKKMQEQLNDQIQQLKDQLKNGKDPGNKHSKEFAKMAAKQAAIRKRIQQIKNENQKQGKGSSKEIQDLIDQMDKIETDLVNKRLPNDMLKRQQDILTRLLEAENAEREREKKEEREAERAEEVRRKLPPELEEYLRERKKQVEMFKTVSPILKPYYRKLVEQYFRSLN